MFAWIHKLILKDNTVSYCFTLCICGGPCHLSGVKPCFPQRAACLFSYWKNKYVWLCIKIVNNQIYSFNFFCETTQCPFKIIYIYTSIVIFIITYTCTYAVNLNSKCAAVCRRHNRMWISERWVLQTPSGFQLHQSGRGTPPAAFSLLSLITDSESGDPLAHISSTLVHLYLGSCSWYTHTHTRTE